MSARYFFVLLGVSVALIAVPPNALAVDADDDTANPNCSLNYNDPDCWDIGVVPNNNGVTYTVTIDDPTPLALDTNVTVDNLTIASGSSFTVANARAFTIVGDTGGGTSGSLIVDGLLRLGAVGADARLIFDSGVSTISSSAAALPGVPTLTSTNSTRNVITGAGNDEQLIFDRQNFTYTGRVERFAAFNARDSLLQPNPGTTSEFRDIRRYEALRSELRASGANTRLLFNNVEEVDGTGTSRKVVENDGTIEYRDSTVENFQYDARGNLRYQLKDRQQHLRDANGNVRFEGRSGRVHQLEGNGGEDRGCNPGPRPHDYDDRIVANDSEFVASGTNTFIKYDRVGRVDGTGTSRKVVENDGTIEYRDSTVENFQYDARGNLRYINSRIDNNTYDVDANGNVRFEGRSGRVENTNLFTIRNDGSVDFANASDTILAARTVFFQETGGKVRSLDTGNVTRKFIEGNGGDEVTFRADALPGVDEYNYDTSDRPRNLIIGTGDTPRVRFENQRVRATGVAQDLDQFTYDRSYLEPNPGTTYAYDNLDRIVANDSEFVASGTNTFIKYDRVGRVDGTGTSRKVVENDGTIEYRDSTVENFQYDARGNLRYINSRIDNNTYDVDANGNVRFEGRSGRVENTNLFTIRNDGSVDFANASDTILAARTVFFQETGGKVRSLDTGNVTRKFIEGNGGDEVTFRADALPGVDEYNYDTSDRPRNLIIGTGDTPRVRFENQRVRATGVAQDLDQFTYDRSYLEPNPGTTYAYDNLDRIVANDSEFVASGTDTTIVYDGVRVLDGTGTTDMRVGPGGSIEHRGGVVRNIRRYDALGRIVSNGATFENNVLNVDPDGFMDLRGSGNRINRSNTLNIAGRKQFSNASTSSVADGTVYTIIDDGSVWTNSTGSPVTVEFGGPTADAVVFTSAQKPSDAPSIASSSSFRNTWNGIGPAANLDLVRQLVSFSGNWNNFDNLLLDQTDLANNPGTAFTLEIRRVTAQNSTLHASGPGGALNIVNAFFDGTESSVIRADDNAQISFNGLRAFDFDGTATNNSTISFSNLVLSNASIGVDETSNMILNNVDVDKVNVGGSVQVAGQFGITGNENQFDAIVTDPGQNTMVMLNGASLDIPLAFADRPGNSLGGTGPLMINSEVSGAAVFNGAALISASGSVVADGNNPIVFDQPGSVNNGRVDVSSGRVILNEDVAGNGNWNVQGDGLLRVTDGRNISANSINVNSGTFQVDGGTAQAAAIVAGAGANMIIGSTLSTPRLEIGLADESAWNLSTTTVIEMTGGEGAAIGDWSDWGVLEIAGLDLGDDPLGFEDNFEIPTLEIGPGASVFLRDFIDNGNRGGPGGESEALYVETLVFSDSFSRLNLNGLNIYFNELQGDASQIINTVVPVPPALWLFGSALAGLRLAASPTLASPTQTRVQA